MDLLFKDLILRSPKFSRLNLGVQGSRGCWGIWIKLLWIAAEGWDDGSVAVGLWLEMMEGIAYNISDIFVGGWCGDRRDQWEELPSGSVCCSAEWQVCVSEVISQSHEQDCTACIRFAESILLPHLFRQIPSLLKKEERSHNKLKLSIKPKLCILLVTYSQVWRLKSRLKPSAPRPRVCIGPEIKTFFPQLFKTSKKWLQLFFVGSDAWRVVSLVPSSCTTTIFIEPWSEVRRNRSLSRTSGMAAPGRQSAMASRKANARGHGVTNN